jgi:hypothetical protein
MNYEKLREQWKSEENYAFKGWNFSHIRGRWKDEVLPWGYREILLSYLKKTDRLLDMGTGGGEFLLSLNHPYNLTSVTEAYPPNVELCRNILEPLGIKVAQVFDDARLPFEKETFDIVINRHESYDTSEVYRILKSGAYFITQQVGGENDNDLSYRLIYNFVPQFPDNNLRNNVSLLKNAGFKIIESKESFTPVRFYDVGALVYFAKIIEWEFPDFSVDTCFDSLCECQRELEKTGYIEGTEHRYMLVAKKL